MELGTILFLTPEPLGFEAICALSQMWDLLALDAGGIGRLSVIRAFLVT